MSRITEIKPGQYYQTAKWIFCLSSELKMQLPKGVLVLITKAETFDTMFNPEKVWIRASGLVRDPFDGRMKVIDLLEMTELGWNENFRLIKLPSDLEKPVVSSKLEPT